MQAGMDYKIRMIGPWYPAGIHFVIWVHLMTIILVTYKDCMQETQR